MNQNIVNSFIKNYGVGATESAFSALSCATTLRLRPEHWKMKVVTDFCYF